MARRQRTKPRRYIPSPKSAAEHKRPVAGSFEPILKRWQRQASRLDLKGCEDRRRLSRMPEPAYWLPDDVASAPARCNPATSSSARAPNRPIARIVEQAAAERDRLWDGLRSAPGTQNESGSLGGSMRPGRTLRTPEFTLQARPGVRPGQGERHDLRRRRPAHHARRAACTATWCRDSTPADKFQWVSVNLMPYKGQRVHLEFTPNDKADFALISSRGRPTAPPPFVPTSQPRACGRC